MQIIQQIYKALYKEYGPQGWWPLIDYKGNNPTKTGSIKGYHPGDYNLPETQNQRFEICIGSILTQNTGWVNTERALTNLKKLHSLAPTPLMILQDDELKLAIKPTGYFNQKAKKIRGFTEFYITLNDRTPTREELLSIWGIGKETADSILLYAFKIPTFVIDAYTRRIFSNLGLIEKNAEYDKIKSLFENNLKPNLIVYQEYHALIVEHAKRHYSKKTEHILCPLYQKFVKWANFLII